MAEPQSLDAAIGQRLVRDDPDAVVVLDAEQRIVRFNLAAETVFGYAESELLGEPLDRLLPTNDVEAHRGYLERFAQEGYQVRQMGERGRVRGRRRSGETFPAEATIGVQHYEGQSYFFAVLRDTSDQEAYEEALVQERNLAHALSQVLGLLTREEPADPETVLDETCRLVVETGGLSLAWIGEPDAEGWLQIRASWGEASGYATEVPISIRPDDAWGQGPSGLAYRSGQPSYVQDVAESPAVAPWRAALLRYGIRASGALPLYRDGQVQGVLNVYADRIGFFAARMTDLLERIACAVTAALERYHHEAERRRLTEVVEAAPDLIGLADENGNVLYNNPAAVQFLGQKGQTGGANIQNFHPDWAAHRILEEGLPQARQSGSWEGETAFLDAEGREWPFSQTLLAHRDAGGEIERYSTIAREISGPKAREAALQEQFQKAVETLVHFVEFFAPELLSHHRHVADWAQRVAVALGCSAEAREQLYFAAILHDIGHLGLNERVRHKAYSLLTNADRQEWRRHPELGEAVLIGMDRMDEPAQLIRHHHERWDGHGIPDGLAGEAIPLGSRILAVVSDYFDLIEGRFYVSKVSSAEAASFLQAGSGSQYDPSVVRAFLTEMGEEAGEELLAQGGAEEAKETRAHEASGEQAPAEESRVERRGGARQSVGRKGSDRRAEGQAGAGTSERRKGWREQRRKRSDEAQGEAASTPGAVQEWRILQLQPGLILEQELRTREGMLLLSPGTVLDDRLTKKLNRLRGHLPRSVQARWPEPDEEGSEDG